MNVLAYNTHLFMDTVVGLDKGTLYQDSTRLDGIAARILSGGWDVVGLSEVWANSSKRRLMDALSPALPYSAWDDNTNFFQVGSGLLLLSRFPVVDHRFVEYRDLVGPDAFSQKGFVMAKLDLGGGERLAVALTHTQAGSSAADVRARNANLTQLAGTFVSWATPGPALLLGDLNVAAEGVDGVATPEYGALLDALLPLGMSDVYRTLHPDAAVDHGFTYDAVTDRLVAFFALEDVENQVRQRLDYVFSSGLTQSSCVVDTSYLYPDGAVQMDLSDHYPLGAVLATPG